MATTTGTEYDHITMSDGTNQVIHYLKDNTARDDIADMRTSTPSLFHDDAITLAGTDDLDNIKMNSAGTYGRNGCYKLVEGTTWSDTDHHFPDGFSKVGRLFVMSTHASGRYVQIIIESGKPPRMWSRYFNGSTWGDWVKIINSDDLADILGTIPTGKTVEDQISELSDDVNYVKANTPAFFYNDTITLAGTDDLNNIKNAAGGAYGRNSSYKLVEGTTWSDTDHHFPDGFSRVGRLFVMSTHASGRYVQILIESGKPPRMWNRYFNGSTWGDWVKIIDSDDLASALSALTSSITQTINTKLSDEYQYVNLSRSAIMSGNGIQGTVGSQIVIQETPSYTHFILSGTANKKFKITIRTSASTKYPHYIFGTDDNAIVKEIFGTSSTASEAKEFIVELGAESTKLYIMVYSAPADVSSRISVYEDVIVKAAPERAMVLAKATADAVMKTRETNIAFNNNVISGATRNPNTSGRELLVGTRALVKKHKTENSNLICFGFITDTHKGGTRTPDYNPQYNIERFVACANEMCSFAVHGGDSITNYEDPTYMPNKAAMQTALTNAMNDFSGLTVPFLFAKGNHDMGVNTYTAITTPSSYTSGLYVYLDEDSTYVAVKNSTEFNAYKAAGETFYTRGNVTLLTNAEYQTIVGARISSAVVYGSTNCGYYYYDVAGKVRVVVLNDYFVYSDGTTTGIDDTQKQFVGTAMTGAISAGLAVLTISHTSYGGDNIIDQTTAFIENGGVYIGHIHGHTHEDYYTNDLGVSNIGVNWGAIPNDKVDGHRGFIFDVFEIDLENKLLYEVRTGDYKPSYISVDRVFDFENQVQLV